MLLSLTSSRICLMRSFKRLKHRHVFRSCVLRSLSVHHFSGPRIDNKDLIVAAPVRVRLATGVGDICQKIFVPGESSF